MLGCVRTACVSHDRCGGGVAAPLTSGAAALPLLPLAALYDAVLPTLKTTLSCYFNFTIVIFLFCKLSSLKHNNVLTALKS